MPDDLLASIATLPGGARVLELLAGRTDVRVVGGAVRDALLGRPARDLDLVVEGDGPALAARLGDVCELHERFGTATVSVDGGIVNVASARSERYAAPGALPDVEPGTFAEDLARRDFTVNALAVDLGGTRHGLPSSEPDLTAGRLRVLHERSFLDDPTRLWRLARYAARLGFGVEERTAELAAEAVAAGALSTVAGPRLGNELRLALDGEDDPGAALTAAWELGLLPGTMRPRRALLDTALALLPADGHRGRLAMATFCGAIAPAALRAWLDALGIEARARDAVLAAATGADALADELRAADRPSAIAAAARGHGTEELALAGALGAEAPARRWLDELRHVRLEIGGDDLLAAGIEPGPELGRRLERALAARLDGEAAGREAELAAALT